MTTELAYRNKLAIAGGGTGVQNRILAIAGRKGSGKSTLNREILQHANRLFIFDTMGEHTWVPDQFTNLDEAYMYIVSAGASDQNFIGSFIPEEAQKDALESAFGEISNAIYEVGNMSFAVEELPMLSTPQYNPPSYDRMIRLGRHRAINLGYTAQRLSEVPRRVTAATDIFVLFSHTEPRDLDAIAERTMPEVARLVSELGDHEFLVYDVASRQLLIVDPGWYDCVLKIDSQWNPAVGGKHGRPALWSRGDDV
jgi:hypothetical protein